MWRVLPALALFLAGCVEIWHYEAEVWVDIPYPPDSAWSLSPVSVVVAGVRQDSGRVLRMFPLLSRERPPEPQIHPVRLELWVDGEKRLELPDTARVHRLRLALPEGWHTLQVRAGTTASRIRHVRVLAPGAMPVRYRPTEDTTALPRATALSTARDTILGIPPHQVRFFFDWKNLQWVVVHPRETLRVRAPRGLHVREFPQGLYVIAFLQTSARAYWIHSDGIVRLPFPSGVGTPIPSAEAVCNRSSAMAIRFQRAPFGAVILFLHTRGVRDTLFPPGETMWLLVCRDGEAGVVSVDVRKHTPFRLPGLPPSMLLYVEGKDTLLLAGGLWWRAGGAWHFVDYPEMPRYRLRCFSGWRRQSLPEFVYQEVFSHPLRCDPFGPSFRILGPRRIRIGRHAYTWSIQEGEKP